jgi:translation initiation factor IF-1
MWKMRVEMRGGEVRKSKIRGKHAKVYIRHVVLFQP